MSFGVLVSLFNRWGTEDCSQVPSPSSLSHETLKRKQNKRIRSGTNSPVLFRERSDELLLLDPSTLTTWSMLQAILWALCWPPRPSRVVGKLAFYPPEYSTYEFVCETEQATTYKLSMRERDTCSVPRDELRRQGTGWLLKTSASGNRVASFYISTKTGETSEYVIILSHANACDLGQVIDFAWLLNRVTGCDILLYDYSGFGLSTGLASEQNLYDDHEAVFEAALPSVAHDKSRIILYGQSIGTAAAVELASREPVGAVILEAPLLSGCRAMFENSIVETCCAGRFLDPFQSERRASKISSPTLIIHGTQDGVVPVKHGQTLAKLCKFSVEPLFIEGAGHCDLSVNREYYDRVRQFILVEVPRFWKREPPSRPPTPDEEPGESSMLPDLGVETPWTMASQLEQNDDVKPSAFRTPNLQPPPSPSPSSATSSSLSELPSAKIDFRSDRDGSWTSSAIALASSYRDFSLELPSPQIGLHMASELASSYWPTRPTSTEKERGPQESKQAKTD